MKNTTILKTAAEVALARTAAQWKAAKHAQRLADWASRLEPASYRAYREGNDWIATGPCGQRFEYSKTERDDVLVISHTGGIYLIEPGEDGQFHCDCEAAKRGGTCKHLAGWDAVRLEHRARREGVRRALAAEAAAMNAERDRASADPAAEYRDYYPGDGEEGAEWIMLAFWGPPATKEAMDALKEQFVTSWEDGEGMTLEEALKALPNAEDRAEFTRFAILFFEDQEQKALDAAPEFEPTCYVPGYGWMVI